MFLFVPFLSISFLISESFLICIFLSSHKKVLCGKNGKIGIRDFINLNPHLPISMATSDVSSNVMYSV